ncbi:siderophore-interacting protein [Lampropedia aestuarii]|uniref:siderophore-interacting protein n=1 Tax=Lampropedia aestuarii TaxID=2562762 RepID=UPI002469235F|nr:siderophore-interacting protein [Lampropedia aestuarii]MDH5857978.1 siderophore-interacting protein [Lampropedia aestuarii]
MTTLDPTTPSPLSAEALAAARQPQRVRHTLHMRRVQVTQVERITPHLIRIALGGEALAGFTSPGFDDHAKLIFPDPQTGQLTLPVVREDGKIDWGDAAQRPNARDYTPRHFDAQSQTLTIDFALHEAGPATAWAERAKPGDELGVGGPRGSFLIPTEFDWHLLVGDDTALPAIWRRLQELPASATALVIAEVDSPEDRVELPSAAQVEVVWAYRQNGSANALLDALRAQTFPAGDCYAWVACESLAAKAAREHLVTERQANPRWVRASGYWRKGSAATHETHE